jgi:SAM-dependent methyltransferase
MLINNELNDLKGSEIWDDCAWNYEKEVVNGHPDIMRFERFEERLLDTVLMYLQEKSSRPLKLIDIGCGSGRLHLHYGKYYKIPTLEIVEGIDFSKNMLLLAQNKIEQEGLQDSFYPVLKLRHQSAFDLPAETGPHFPVVVNLLNSIGVMQGPEGAQKLFVAMRRAVENSGGIALISCYKKESVKSHALPQYESTLNVSGQPVWLEPNDYSGDAYTLLPKYYKRTGLDETTIDVEVYDEHNNLIKTNYMLFRNNKKVNEAIQSGVIQTFKNYTSNWYSFEQIKSWIKKYWGDLPNYHLSTAELDAQNAEAGQIAVLDCRGCLSELFQR